MRSRELQQFNGSISQKAMPETPEREFRPQLSSLLDVSMIGLWKSRSSVGP